MNPNLQTNDIFFNSNFEGGNLDVVVSLKDFEYDLYLRPDTNTAGF